MAFGERPAKLRWPRSQKFVLSARGVEAETSYRELIVASRDGAGRASFDQARATWAGNYQLEADDGLYLAEVKAGAANLPKLIAALETCGKTRPDAIAAIERLVDQGFLSPTA
jgi:hypothetical protein